MKLMSHRAGVAATPISTDFKEFEKYSLLWIISLTKLSIRGKKVSAR